MDEEGFSGRDGRTTIFDWWSISSIRRLRRLIETGEYRSLDPKKLVKAGLRKEEAEVFCRFAEAVRLAASDEAVRKGTTYDLCYCNMSSDGFDKNRHFVFLRDHEEHTLLIAANFSGQEARMKITIPDHYKKQGTQYRQRRETDVIEHRQKRTYLCRGMHYLSR